MSYVHMIHTHVNTQKQKLHLKCSGNRLLLLYFLLLMQTYALKPNTHSHIHTSKRTNTKPPEEKKFVQGNNKQNKRKLSFYFSLYSYSTTAKRNYGRKSAALLF